MIRITVLKGDVERPLGEQPEESGIDVPMPEDHELFAFRSYPLPPRRGSDPNTVTWRWIATLTSRVAT